MAYAISFPFVSQAVERFLFVRINLNLMNNVVDDTRALAWRAVSCSGFFFGRKPELRLAGPDRGKVAKLGERSFGVA